MVVLFSELLRQQNSAGDENFDMEWYILYFAVGLLTSIILNMKGEEDVTVENATRVELNSYLERHQ